jgi:hypothetical protein
VALGRLTSHPVKVTRQRSEGRRPAEQSGSYAHDVFSFERDGTSVNFRLYADSVGVARLGRRRPLAWHLAADAPGDRGHSGCHRPPPENEGVDDILAYHPELGAYAPFEDAVRSAVRWGQLSREQAVELGVRS